MFRTLVELVPDMEEVASYWRQTHLTSDLSRESIRATPIRAVIPLLTEGLTSDFWKGPRCSAASVSIRSIGVSGTSRRKAAWPHGGRRLSAPQSAVIGSLLLQRGKVDVIIDR